jgi:hypothetical protein
MMKMVYIKYKLKKKTNVFEAVKELRERKHIVFRVIRTTILFSSSSSDLVCTIS